MIKQPTGKLIVLEVKYPELNDINQFLIFSWNHVYSSVTSKINSNKDYILEETKDFC